MSAELGSKLIINGENPRHIAIIMDGNGRWAQKRMMPRIMGHHAGVKTVRKIVEYCAKETRGVVAVCLQQRKLATPER